MQFNDSASSIVIALFSMLQIRLEFAFSIQNNCSLNLFVDAH